MKGIISALLLVLSSSVFAQCPHLDFGIPYQSDQVLCREGYALGYNYELKSADWVVYRLERELDEGVERQGDFRPDPDIPFEFQTTKQDYDEPDYHMGHLANSESIDRTPIANSETFLMSNMTPQLPTFNTGIWKGLENRERKWADLRGEVLVIIGALYEPNPQVIGNQVPIPVAFWKVVFDPQAGEAIAYLIPHQNLYTRDLPKYLTSIDVIEEVSGLNLLSALPVSEQAVIEEVIQRRQWATR